MSLMLVRSILHSNLNPFTDGQPVSTEDLRSKVLDVH